jgi:NAD(P)-dependent dehydrogenase (short-subunit alcohol dehydrogenase family)
LLSHIITAKYAAPLMIKKKRGLIVEVVEGDLLFASGNVLMQTVKCALQGLAVTMAAELRPHKVAAVAITPGYLRSETMLQHFAVTEKNWRDGAKEDPNFLASESPLFVGRAVAALAWDKKVLARSGNLISSWELGREYGLTDVDGSRPDWGKYGTEMVIPSMAWMREGVRLHADWLSGLARRAREYLGEGSPSPS